MSLIIPLRGDIPYYDFQVTLEGVTYTMEVRWNVRLQAPFLAIFDAQGTTPILVGLRMVVNWPLGAYNTGRGLPGNLMLIDTSNQNREVVSMEDLGKRCQLLYFSSAELAAGEAAFEE